LSKNYLHLFSNSNILLTQQSSACW
jgi:hypothetical protein